MVDHDSRERLMALLLPVHDRTRLLARRLCRSAADGDDLFQEAVLRALVKLPTLQDDHQFGGWFYAVLLSVHRNRARRSFWRRFLPLGPQSEPGGAQDGAAWEERRYRDERLSRALSRLPAVQREAVVLYEVEGFSVEEVARLQRVSVSAVKSRLARARARLRRTYEEESAEPTCERPERDAVVKAVTERSTP
jgi:RNA polymerase sigma-70 factor (ECF subfamily)